jgi:hypothetical protein
MLDEEAQSELMDIYRETETMDLFSERNARKLILMINDAIVASSFVRTSNGAIIHKNMTAVKLHRVPEYVRAKKGDEANAYHELFAQVREALIYLNSEV